MSSIVTIDPKVNPPNKGQIALLGMLFKKGKTSVGEIDGRKISALERRGLVKITSNSKGEFVSALAKAKRFIN